MYKNFMIGFMYEGYFYCANVHRYTNPSPEYHVSILANRVKDNLPARIVLKDEGHTLRPASNETVSPALLNSIISEIQKRTK